MMLKNLPEYAGVVAADFPYIAVTGKAGGAFNAGTVVESTDDGLSWTSADTGNLTDSVQDLATRGVVMFDPAKGTANYATGDKITVVIWGIVACRAVGTAGIDEFELLQAGTSTDVGRVRVSTYASANSVTHDHFVRVLQSHVGLALNAQNGAADSLVWVFVGVRA